MESGQTRRNWQGLWNSQYHWTSEVDFFTEELQRWRDSRDHNRLNRGKNGDLLFDNELGLRSRFRNHDRPLSVLLQLRDWRAFHHVQELKIKETAWWTEIRSEDEDGCHHRIVTITSDAELLRADHDNLGDLEEFHESHQQAREVVKSIEREIEKVLSTTTKALPSSDVDIIEQQLMQDLADMEAKVRSISGISWRQTAIEADLDLAKRLVKLERHILGLQEDYYEWVENSESIRFHPDCPEQPQADNVKKYIKEHEAMEWRRFISRRKLELDRSVNRHDCWRKVTQDCQKGLQESEETGIHTSDNEQELVYGLQSIGVACKDMLDAGRRLYEAQRAEALYHEWKLRSQKKTLENSPLGLGQSSDASNISAGTTLVETGPRKRKVEWTPSQEPPPKRLATVDLRTQSYQTCSFITDISARNGTHQDLALATASRKPVISYQESVWRRLRALRARSLHAKVSKRLKSLVSMEKRQDSARLEKSTPLEGDDPNVTNMPLLIPSTNADLLARKSVPHEEEQQQGLQEAERSSEIVKAVYKRKSIYAEDSIIDGPCKRLRRSDENKSSPAPRRQKSRNKYSRLRLNSTPGMVLSKAKEGRLKNIASAAPESQSYRHTEDEISVPVNKQMAPTDQIKSSAKLPHSSPNFDAVDMRRRSAQGKHSVDDVTPDRKHSDEGTEIQTRQIHVPERPSHMLECLHRVDIIPSPGSTPTTPFRGEGKQHREKEKGTVPKRRQLYNIEESMPNSRSKRLRPNGVLETPRSSTWIPALSRCGLPEKENAAITAGLNSDPVATTAFREEGEAAPQEVNLKLSKKRKSECLRDSKAKSCHKRKRPNGTTVIPPRPPQQPEAPSSPLSKAQNVALEPVCGIMSSTEHVTESNVQPQGLQGKRTTDIAQKCIDDSSGKRTRRQEGNQRFLKPFQSPEADIEQTDPGHDVAIHQAMASSRFWCPNQKFRDSHMIQ